MFWRSYSQPVSKINNLLTDPDIQLEDLFTQDDLLQECKHNNQLINFLCEEHNINKLINYAVHDLEFEEDSEESAERFSYLSSEILNSEVWSICESLVQSNESMELLWSFLDKPAPLDPFKASRFSKIIISLTQKCPEMRVFISEQQNIPAQFLTHITSSPIVELLQKLINFNQNSDPDSQWFPSSNIIFELLNRLDPKNDVEIIETSNLILMEILTYKPLGYSHNFLGDSGSCGLIREFLNPDIVDKFVSCLADLDSPNFKESFVLTTPIINELLKRFPQNDPRPELLDDFQASDFFPLVEKLAENIPKICELINTDKNKPSEMTNSVGTFIPLGPVRLKACELLVNIFQVGYRIQNYLHKMPEDSEKSPNLKSESSESNTDRISINHSKNSDESSSYNRSAHSKVCESIFSKFLEFRVVSSLLDLFFEFKWNSFLHHHIYQLLHLMFSVSVESALDSYNALILDFFHDKSLISHIIEAQELNNSESLKFGGTRLGYMGYVTLISEEFSQFLEKTPDSFTKPFESQLNEPEWQKYVTETLPDQKELQNRVLGGKSIASFYQPTHSSYANDDDYQDNDQDNYRDEVDDYDQQDLNDDQLTRFLQGQDIEGEVYDLNFQNDEDEDDDDYYGAEIGWEDNYRVSQSYVQEFHKKNMGNLQRYFSDDDEIDDDDEDEDEDTQNALESPSNSDSPSNEVQDVTDSLENAKLGDNEKVSGIDSETQLSQETETPSS